MNARYARIMAGAALAVGLVVPAAHAQSQAVIEKIPLQHIDARIVAAVLGAPVLPLEDRAILQRFQGGLAAPSYGGGPGGGYYGGYATGGYPGMGFANSRVPAVNRTFPSRYAPGNGALVDPRTNTMLFGR